jgi:hypothetical protein
MKTIPVQYYGDDVRWFIATVIDARPPKGENLEGRVQIRIHGTMSPSTRDIPQADLPWAQVLIPTTEGGTSGLGATPRLEAGTIVFGFFMDGKSSQTPIVLGSLPTFEYASPIQVGQDPGFVEEPFTNPRATVNEDLVENSNVGEISEETRLARQSEAIRYLTANGWSREQAVGMTAALDISSGMVTGYSQDGQRYGIGGWQETDAERLRNSIENFDEFGDQLEFVNSEAKNSNLSRARTLSANDKSNGNTVVASLEVLKADQEALTNRAINTANTIHDQMGGG